MSDNRLDQLFQYLAANPDDSFARFCIAQEYKKQGHREKARFYLEQLQEQDPNYIGTYYHLGKLHEEAGEEEQAATIYKQGMTIAQQKGDQHSYNELQQACQLVEGFDEDEFDEQP